MKDIIGMKFGRLKVKSIAATNIKHGKPNITYLCICDCGKEKIVSHPSLLYSKVSSCGCLQKEIVKSIGQKNRKHGKTPKKLYRVWEGIHERCRDKKHISYSRYGGQGVTVCQEWSDYTVFRDWALNSGYREGLSIDRLNSNGNYEPSNCRWTDTKTQSRNRRSNKYITLNGETLTYADWEKKLGLSRGVIHWRISAGWTEEEAVFGKNDVGETA
jgi:hypothetical protein